MRKAVTILTVVIAVVVLGTLAADFARLRLVLVSPTADDATGQTLLVQSVPDVLMVDSLNSYCLRNAGAVTDRCRQGFLAELSDDGATLARLPYLPWLDQQSSLPPEVEH